MASLVVAGDSSGSVTLAAPAVAGTTTLTLPTSSGTLVVTGGAQTVQFAAGSAAAPSITFTGDTNTGIFSPSADAIAFTEGGVESMRIDASGNVGIGLTSYTGKLAVNGVIATYASTDNNYRGSMDVENGNLRFIAPPFASNPTNMVFHTGSASTERMRIDSSGNVGIGLSNPSFRLDVARGSSGVVLNLQGTDAYNAETGITFSTQRAKISGFLEGTGGIPGASLRFFTMPNEGSITERMRITSGGDLLVGATSGNTSRGVFARASATSNTDATLSLIATNSTNVLLGMATPDSAVCLRKESGVASIDAVTGNQSNYTNFRASAFSVQSDYRVKENIAPIENAISKVNQLNPVRFNYVEGCMSYTGGNLVDGFLAHEVSNIVPEAVIGDKDAVKEDGTPLYQSLDQAKLIPIMVKAIQEQQQIINDLKARIETLEGAK